MALGEIGAPIGLAGAVRLHTLKSVTGLPIEDSLLMQSTDCWVYLAQAKPVRWLYSEIQECSVQTRGLKLRLQAIQTRDQAEQLRGAQVGLSRSVFPEPSDDEATGRTCWAARSSIARVAGLEKCSRFRPMAHMIGWCWMPA